MYGRWYDVKMLIQRRNNVVLKSCACWEYKVFAETFHMLDQYTLCVQSCFFFGNNNKFFGVLHCHCKVLKQTSDINETDIIRIKSSPDTVEARRRSVKYTRCGLSKLTEYDLQRGVCCYDKWFYMGHSAGACCGYEGFDTSLQTCCGGHVYRKPNVNTGCCDGKVKIWASFFQQGK